MIISAVDKIEQLTSILAIQHPYTQIPSGIHVAMDPFTTHTMSDHKRTGVLFVMWQVCRLHHHIGQIAIQLTSLKKRNADDSGGSNCSYSTPNLKVRCNIRHTHCECWYFPRYFPDKD